MTGWDTGTTLREFLHVDDLGEAYVCGLEHWDPAASDAPSNEAGQPLPLLNVGTGVDLAIRELAEAVADAIGYRGRLGWDTSRPDGTPNKQLDVSRLANWAGAPASPGLRGCAAR